MRVRSIAFLLLAILSTDKVSAQSADLAEIDRLTAKALKHLTTNSRFAYKSRPYGDLEFGKTDGYTTVECYFGETTGVERATEVRTDPKSEEKFGTWVNGDQLICTKKGDSGGTVIFRHHVPWTQESEADHFASFYGWMGLGYIVWGESGSKYGRSRNPDSVPRAERTNPPVTTITEEIYKGRPCYKVLVSSNSNRIPSKPITKEYFVDKQHGMLLGNRQNRMLHVPKGTTSATVLDVDQVTEVSYGPPTENGLPFPTAVKGWYVWPTGRREPMTDVVFTEFKRYTPTADELDFQKQFGIPLPSLPPKPGVLAKAGGSRATRWLAGGFGIAVIAALVVYVRRRRTGAQSVV